MNFILQMGMWWGGLGFLGLQQGRGRKQYQLYNIYKINNNNILSLKEYLYIFSNIEFAF
jgi:hypothetical protein